MDYNQILKEVENSSWQPKFEFTTDLHSAIDSILIPHEDYILDLHLSVRRLISIALQDAKHYPNYEIHFGDACNMQKYLLEVKHQRFEAKFKNKSTFMPNMHIKLGLRQNEVSVGSWKPPHPIYLKELIAQIFPVCQHSIYGALGEGSYEDKILNQITDWYKVFQTIHPFEDLNGRVGGIIINVLSQLSVGKWIINTEYKKRKA